MIYWKNSRIYNKPYELGIEPYRYPITDLRIVHQARKVIINDDNNFTLIDITPPYTKNDRFWIAALTDDISNNRIALRTFCFNYGSSYINSTGTIEAMIAEGE